MLRLTWRAGRWPLALALITLGACSDDAVTTAPSLTPKPHFSAGEVLTVTNTSGGTDAGSLRWAIEQATGGEIIRFDSGLAGDTIFAGGTVEISVPLTIEGPKDKGITITSSRNGGVVRSSAVTLTLRNMTITGGKSLGSGGGVLTNGDLVLENTTVARNEGSSTAAISGKTITLINSTVSGNTSISGYAAIFGDTKLTVVNSTIANNGSGGIQNDATSSLVLRNSVLAGNGTKPNCTSTGTPVYEGRNLSSDWSCGDSTIIIVAAAKLDSLSDNGGPSPTHALDRTSRAINAGTECSVTADQRHVARDAKCDLGAFEFTDFTVITVTFDPSVAVNSATGNAVLTGTVRCTTEERVDLTFSLEQLQKVRRGQATVRAEAAQTMDCGPTPRGFASLMMPASGGFINTAATAKANASSPPAWVAPSETITPVKLYWSHR